jgi:uncharacterized membrane protein YphA (DoxX/SURF4 family)
VSQGQIGYKNLFVTCERLSTPLGGGENYMDSRLDRAWWVLRIGLGVGPILAGLDKFFNFFTNWEMYLNPLVPKLLHIQPGTFMHVVGIVEMLVGIAVLTRYTRYAALVVMVWMWGIAANLVSQWAFLDIAMRDVEISLAAFTLAVLSEVRQAAAERPAETTPIRANQRSVA